MGTPLFNGCVLHTLAIFMLRMYRAFSESTLSMIILGTEAVISHDGSFFSYARGATS